MKIIYTSRSKILYIVTGLVMSIMSFTTCKSGSDKIVEESLLDQMEEGWNAIEPGGNTICSQGTPFSFYVRPGHKDKVLIFLNGGGACWSGDLCDLKIEPTPYIPFADFDHNVPDNHYGIFEIANEENPFKDWTMVFIPYCTGDVHLGNADKEYTTSRDTNIIIYHRGKANAMAAINWTAENIKDPEKIFVAGASAGSIASPYYAGVVAELYPASSVIQLGDGSGGYRSEVGAKETSLHWGTMNGIPTWLVEDQDKEFLTFEDIYILTSKKFPNIQFSQINAAYDKDQEYFLKLLGNESPLYPLLTENLNDIASVVPDFTYYTYSGNVHTVLRSPIFYTYTTEGVSIVDWVSQLADGQTPGVVSCGHPESCLVYVE